MKNRPLPRGNGMWTEWSIVALVLVTVCPLAAFGAERTVICEEITDTG